MLKALGILSPNIGNKLHLLNNLILKQLRVTPNLNNPTIIGMKQLLNIIGNILDFHAFPLELLLVFYHQAVVLLLLLLDFVRCLFMDLFVGFLVLLQHVGR